MIELEQGAEELLDKKFLDPFMTATLKVLEVQAKIIARAGRGYKKNETSPPSDVCGIIEVVGPSFSGTMVVGFPKATFLRVMSNMIGEECSEVNQDIVDGTGEIVNMIFGQAKIDLNQKGHGIQMALPRVTTDIAQIQRSTEKGTSVIVPFESSAGEFFVEMRLAG